MDLSTNMWGIYGHIQEFSKGRRKVAASVCTHKVRHPVSAKIREAGVPPTSTLILERLSTCVNFTLRLITGDTHNLQIIIMVILVTGEILILAVLIPWFWLDKIVTVGRTDYFCYAFMFVGTLLCYGQTGAGKTFTMTGTTENYKHRGMIPRAISQVRRSIYQNF